MKEKGSHGGLWGSEGEREPDRKSVNNNRKTGVWQRCLEI